MKPVSSLMTKDVVTLGRNDVLSAADDLMKASRIRHMPILDDDGRLVGILSQRDLFLNALVRALGFGTVAGDKARDRILVKEVMTSEVVTTTPDTPLPEAAQVMVERKIGCLPVIERDALVGILTESDFVAAAAAGSLA